jgi:hypothetical protein
MKPIMFVGLVLIVLGALALIYQGITFTGSKKIIDFDSIQVSAESERTILVPPLLGGLVLACGIALVIVGRKKP